MKIMLAIGCILLCGEGHLFRDGWPSFKNMLSGLQTGPFRFLYHLSTQLARVTGALLCAAGAGLVLTEAQAAWIGLAVLVGFYTDMKHGEGQGAGQASDVAYLALSGVTSLVPLVVAVALLFSGWHLTVIHTPTMLFREMPWIIPGDPGLPALLLAVGLIKPLIWFTAKAVKYPNIVGLYYTRVAAFAFGAAAVGGIIVGMR